MKSLPITFYLLKSISVAIQKYYVSIEHLQLWKKWKDCLNSNHTENRITLICISLMCISIVTY
jgi:hypothetical protein